jgi:L-ascorbate metabolism protein UlaG (beta-lactamase superfamily)
VKRTLRLLALVFLAGLVGLAWHVGFLQARQPWAQATGWHELEAAPDPTSRFYFKGGEAIDLHWLGHAGFLLEWAGQRLLLDPNTSLSCTLAQRALERPVEASELGSIDAALVSHGHYDHLDLPTLLGLPQLGEVLLPRGSAEYVAKLEEMGSEIVELDEGESRWVGDLEVLAVHAKHNGNRFHPLQDSKQALGYVIRRGGNVLYFAGDTGYGDHFARIGEVYRPQIALLPIGAYAPRFPMRFYHLNPEEAVQAGFDLGSSIVVPMHFGTFALALDRPSSALPRFARAAKEEGLAWDMPALLGSQPQEVDPRGR